MASPGCIWLDLRSEEERRANPLPAPEQREAVYGMPEREVVELSLGEVSPLQQTDALGDDQAAPVCCVATDGVEAAQAKEALESQGFNNVTSGSFDEVKASAAAGKDLEMEAFVYARLAVQNTLPLLGGMVSLISLIVVIVATLGHGNLTEDSGYDWVISESVASQRWDGYKAARDQVDQVGPGSGRRVLLADEGFEARFDSSSELRLSRRRRSQDETETRSEASDGNSLLLLFETKDGTSIFTPQHLQSICKVEQILLGRAEYPQVGTIDRV